jgi:hypothetical protein
LEQNSKSCEALPRTNIEPLVFLMTTRVGGVGLNLTQATRVIIADPSDNPRCGVYWLIYDHNFVHMWQDGNFYLFNSEDNQAVDRAYRYGQERDVIVYRLMSCAAIEEHTYREQVSKYYL